ncbi:MAG: purine nucleoside permease [Pseudomonadota bacterium]
MRRTIETVLGVVLLGLLSGCDGSVSVELDSDETEAEAIRVVVVTMFENGDLSGDRPGEFQYWVERWPLARQVDFPMGEYPLRLDDQGVLGICVGGGIANAAASIMALAQDERFDLRRAYWIVAGIAGGDPEDVSLGSAVWARHVVDGDLLYEIDAREIPADWPYGLIPLGAKAPAETPEDISTGWTLDTIHFPLNAALAEWAFEQTRSLELKDTEAMAAFRAQYAQRPNAQRPPFVTLGDTLASSTYWHGARLNSWANDWVPLYAGADAEFMTTNMEDTGTLTALGRLARTARVDPERVMVLRTVSNFSAPPTGKTAAWSTTAPYPDQGEPAIDSAYRVASTVVTALLDGWSTYEETPPGTQATPAAAGD